MGEQRIRTRCACGWESTGGASDVIRATIDHGRRIHNMVGTPEQVLAQAEILEPGDGPAAVDADDPAGA